MRYQFSTARVCGSARKVAPGTNVLLLDPQPRTYHRHQKGSEVRLWDACLSSTRSPRWSFWVDCISSSLPTTVVEEPKRCSGSKKRALVKDASSTSAGSTVPAFTPACSSLHAVSRMLASP